MVVPPSPQLPPEARGSPPAHRPARSLARGGTPFAGGRAFPTPYGTVFSSNLTPDPVHGIGAWSLAEFRHAMRHGVSRNGIQSPVFPYANFALLDDADLDALFVFLRALPPSDATVPDGVLRVG